MTEMTKYTSANFTLFFSICVSVFGLLTTLMFALLPSAPMENLSWRKPLIGTIFIATCISGGSASFFPRKCSEQSGPQREKGSTASARALDRRNDVEFNIKGHHPNCGEFSAHIIQTRGRTICAACTGLFLGALIAILGTILYFFLEWEYGQFSSAVVPLGSIGVTIGFFQLEFKGITRSALNTLFVIGAYLILAGVDMLSRNVLLDIYVIGLIFSWIWTRTLLSQWDHSRVCRSCKLDCELKEKEQR